MIFVQDLTDGGGQPVQVFRHASAGGGGEDCGAVEIPGPRLSGGSPVEVAELVIAVYDVSLVQFRQQGGGFSGQGSEEFRRGVRSCEQSVTAPGIFERFIDDVTGMQEKTCTVFADRQNGGSFDSCADQSIGRGGGAERARPAEQITEYEAESLAVGPFEKNGTDRRKIPDCGCGGPGVFQGRSAGKRGIDRFQKLREILSREERRELEIPAAAVKADGLFVTVPDVHNAFVFLRGCFSGNYSTLLSGLQKNVLIFPGVYCIWYTAVYIIYR